MPFYTATFQRRLYEFRQEPVMEWDVYAADIQDAVRQAIRYVQTHLHRTTPAHSGFDKSETRWEGTWYRWGSPEVLLMTLRLLEGE